MCSEREEDYQFSKKLFKLLTLRRNWRRKTKVRIKRTENSQVWQLAQNPQLMTLLLSTQMKNNSNNNTPLGSSRHKPYNINNIFTLTWNLCTLLWLLNTTIYNKIIVDEQRIEYLWGQIRIDAYCSIDFVCVLLD